MFLCNNVLIVCVCHTLTYKHLYGVSGLSLNYTQTPVWKKRRWGSSISPPFCYGQDIIQGQFLSGVLLVWNQNFSFPILVAIPRLKSSTLPGIRHISVFAYFLGIITIIVLFLRMYHHHECLPTARIPLTLSCHPYRLSSLLISPNGTQCPHRTDVCIYPTPPPRAGYDTKSIFKQSATSLNLEFTFF